MDMRQDDQLIPIGVAARLLGVSVATMRRWDRTGRLPAVRLPGGQRRYRAADIEAVRAGLHAKIQRVD